jgi:hypothetical protein
VQQTNSPATRCWNLHLGPEPFGPDRGPRDLLPGTSSTFPCSTLHSNSTSLHCTNPVQFTGPQDCNTETNHPTLGASAPPLYIIVYSTSKHCPQRRRQEDVVCFRQLSKIHRFQVMFVQPKGKSSALKTGCRPVVPRRQEPNRGRERESKKKNTQGSQKFKRNILKIDYNWCYLGEGFNWLTWVLLEITPYPGYAEERHSVEQF